MQTERQGCGEVYLHYFDNKIRQSVGNIESEIQETVICGSATPHFLCVCVGGEECASGMYTVFIFVFKILWAGQPNGIYILRPEVGTNQAIPGEFSLYYFFTHLMINIFYS